MTPSEYDAHCLYEAMKGLEAREDVLAEIIGSRKLQEIQEIKQVYAANYGELLENHVANDTSGDYKKLLLALVQGQRRTNTKPDMAGVFKMLMLYIKQEKENVVLMKIPLLESSQKGHLLN